MEEGRDVCGYNQHGVKFGYMKANAVPVPNARGHILLFIYLLWGAVTIDGPSVVNKTPRLHCDAFPGQISCQDFAHLRSWLHL